MWVQYMKRQNLKKHKRMESWDKHIPKAFADGVVWMTEQGDVAEDGGERHGLFEQQFEHFNVLLVDDGRFTWHRCYKG